MTRYIDAELLKENFGKRLNNRFGITIKIDDAVVDLGLAIADTPTADVVEVVRCEKCTHKVDYCGRIMCAKNARRINDGIVGLTATSPEHFCSYGERKDA